MDDALSQCCASRAGTRWQSSADEARDDGVKTMALGVDAAAVVGFDNDTSDSSHRAESVAAVPYNVDAATALAFDIEQSGSSHSTPEPWPDDHCSVPDIDGHPASPGSAPGPSRTRMPGQDRGPERGVREWAKPGGGSGAGGMPWFSSAWLPLVSKIFPLTSCTQSVGGQAVVAPGLDCKPRSETDWEARMRIEDSLFDAQLQTGGSIGRVVAYEAGEQPCGDVVLRGGGGQRVRVRAVCQSGRAARAGVRSGDLLVSINGSRDFKDQPLEELYAGLSAPAVLVFLGLISNCLTAELRIKRKEVPCGLPSQQLFAESPKDRPHVVEEVVFEAAQAFD